MDTVEKALRLRGAEVVRERFRLPARPQISPAAGFGTSAAAGFLLSAGRPYPAFLLGALGVVVLLLDAYGYTPLDWLGPKAERAVLVVPGTPTSGTRKAFFIGVPLERASSAARDRRGAFGMSSLYGPFVLLAIVQAAAAAASALLYLPPLPRAAALSGAALLLFAAAEGVRKPFPARLPNEAASWADRLPVSPDAPFRPHLLVYSGDPAEVKFFLAKYRGALFRGSGMILEFPGSGRETPAMSIREGPFLPCRVDATLRATVHVASGESGFPDVADLVVPRKSAGLVAMGRGFRTVTLFGPDLPGAAARDAAVAMMCRTVEKAGNLTG